MRKNTIKKLMAAVLTAAMSVSLIAAAPAPKEQADSTGDNTVYVMTDASGKPEKLLLTDTLAQALPDGKAKGLAMYDSDGVKLEKPGIDDDLPLEISISYTLDGKKISPKKLAGKSGHVVIRYDYKNLCKTKAEIAGEEEEIYVPFAVMTGMVLDNTSFKNISVSSGKVVSDGTRSIVAGLAVPGLQENLNLSRETIDLPEFVEISADVENFELDMSLTMVTNDLFGDKELEIDTADIEAAVAQLREAMNMLLDGSSQLFDGICQLFDKSGMLVDGVTQLYEGMNELDSHSGELNDAAGLVFDSMLNMGTNVITKLGLSSVALTRDNYRQVLGDLINSLDGNVLLDTALDKIIETLDLPEIHKTAELFVMHDLEVAARQAEYDRVRAEVIEQGDSAISRETAENNVRAQALINKTAEVRKEILTELLNGRNYDELAPIEKAGIEAKLAIRLAKPETTADINARVDAYMATDEAQALIESKVADGIEIKVAAAIAQQHDTIEKNVRASVDAQMAAPENQNRVEEVFKNMIHEAALALLTDDIKAQIQNMADEGAKALGELLAGLTGYEQFYYGVLTYTAGVGTARAGVETLYSNMPALEAGVRQLRDGGEMLNNGIIQFDEQGISRITGALDGEVGELKERIEASYEAARAYRAISSLPDDFPAVSFVYRSASISRD